jgi:uncharacterized membrane protein
MDALKAAWQAMPGHRKNVADLRSMLLKGNHPVLKKLRRQVIFESLCFGLVLLFYYDIFDGDRKPLLQNVLLVTGLLLVIGHGLLGYAHTRRTVSAVDLREALTARLKQLRTFAVLSILFRMLSMGCLLAFFTYGLLLTMEKQVILGGIVLTLMVQFGLMAWMWERRIRKLGEALNGLQDDTTA